MAQASERDSAHSAAIEIDSVSFRIREAGSGPPLVIFGDGPQADALMNGLAARNRALVIGVTGDGGSGARKLAAAAAGALARIKLETFSMIGISHGAELALALAVFAPNQIDKLILLSPPPLGTLDEGVRSGFGRIAAPTLVMVGTNDRSGAAETMRTLREKVPACHVLLIYGAGESIVSDRADSCLTPIGEFLERGIEFVVCHESQVLRR